MDAPTRLRIRGAGWRWRRNPLRRRSDVVEAWTRVLLAAVLLIGGPLAGVFAGALTYDTLHTRAARQRAEGRVVSATLLEDAPAVGGTSSRAIHPVTVRWTDRGGRVRTATAKVPAGATAGSRTGLWLDARGRATAAPMATDVQWGTAITVGCGAALMVWTFTWGIWMTARVVSCRRRMAEWERDWARTAPRWSGGES
ncbi:MULTISPECIES: Rv1733c family protein [unclassified Streptomyces]|uniref:Rv1733c family protein n=1 Tax=Streptomyces sp. SYP-A7185 TaxID=3040076 RepID=UPI0038F776C8